jgi:hypothetical protein
MLLRTLTMGDDAMRKLRAVFAAAAALLVFAAVPMWDWDAAPTAAGQSINT